MKRGQELQSTAVHEGESALRVDAHNNAMKDGKGHSVDDASRMVRTLHCIGNETSNCSLHIPLVIKVRGEVNA
jgi:hypothetical protein